MEMPWRDWRLWAAVALVLGGVVLLQLTGAGGGVTEEGFVGAHRALGETARHFDTGDVAAAEHVFMGEADPFLHRLDPVLRRQNAQLAERLWDHMGRIELALMQGDVDAARMAEIVRRSASLLERAAEELEMTPRWDVE